MEVKHKNLLIISIAVLLPNTSVNAEYMKGCDAVAIRNTKSVDQTTGKTSECFSDKNYKGEIVKYCASEAKKGRLFVVSPDPSPNGIVWCEHGGECWSGKDLKITSKCRNGHEYSR